MPKKINVPPPTRPEVKDAARGLPKGHSADGRVLVERELAKKVAKRPQRRRKLRSAETSTRSAPRKRASAKRDAAKRAGTKR